MATLRFAADNSESRWALPSAADFSSDFTLAILLQFQSPPSFYAMIVHEDSNGTPVIDFEVDNAGALFLEVNGSTDDGDGGNHIDTADWHIMVVTVTGGLAEYADYNLTSGSWNFGPGGNALPIVNSQVGGSIVVGQWQGQDDLDANVAVVGGWPTAMTESQISELSTHLCTSDWANTTVGSPAYLFEMTSDLDIPDLMGNATFSSNTAVLDTGNNPPGWRFDGLGSIGTPTTATGTTASASVAVPSGLAPGDEVVLIHTNDNGSSSTIPTPAGFTVLANGFINGDGQRYWIGWKRMGATPDTGSYVQTISATDWAMTCIPIHGRDSTNPPVLSAINQSTVAVGTATANGLTALAGDDILFINIPDHNNTTVITHSGWPSTYTEIVDVGRAWSQIGVAKLDDAFAGATGNQSVTMSATSAYAAWLLRLPASTGGGGGGTTFPQTITVNVASPTITARKQAGAVKRINVSSSVGAPRKAVAKGAIRVNSATTVSVTKRLPKLFRVNVSSPTVSAQRQANKPVQIDVPNPTVSTKRTVGKGIRVDVPTSVNIVRRAFKVLRVNVASAVSTTQSKLAGIITKVVTVLVSSPTVSVRRDVDKTVRVNVASSVSLKKAAAITLAAAVNTSPRLTKSVAKAIEIHQAAQVSQRKQVNKTATVLVDYDLSLTKLIVKQIRVDVASSVSAKANRIVHMLINVFVPTSVSATKQVNKEIDIPVTTSVSAKKGVTKAIDVAVSHLAEIVTSIKGVVIPPPHVIKTFITDTRIFGSRSVRGRRTKGGIDSHRMG